MLTHNNDLRIKIKVSYLITLLLTLFIPSNSKKTMIENLAIFIILINITNKQISNKDNIADFSCFNDIGTGKIMTIILFEFKSKINVP